MLFAFHGVLFFLLLDCVLAKTPINVNHFIIKSASTKMGLQSSQLQLLFQTLSREGVCIFLANNNEFGISIWYFFLILCTYSH